MSQEFVNAVTRRALVVAAALALALTVAPALATTTVAGQFSPKTIAPKAAFSLTFASPVSTGIRGKNVYYVEVQGTNSNPATFTKTTCISSFNLIPAYGVAGAKVTVSTRPSTRWCAGTYHVQVLELNAPVCLTQGTCPNTVRHETSYFLLSGKLKVK